jgi:hypothetical protein
VRCTIPLRGKGNGPAVYRLSLHFADDAHGALVKVQGRAVADKGGVYVVQGVKVKDALVVEVAGRASLCGLLVERER